MNTLANHGYLPHDGKNLTKETVVAGLGNGLNFDPVLAGIMWEQAIFVAGPNATAFTLNDLNPHGVLEHDASLSRSDAHFGSNHVFNQTVFDTSKAFFTDETITIRMIADAKVFRQVISRSTNPDYSFSASVENFSLGEMAAPFLALGDKTNGLVNRTLVEFWIVR
ncbi:putative sterigmatocystin biosynthesis peroxidase stcC [Glarea lozoyensis 74030]|uniref:Putative sterigmatocystin biosynthesis peroxidase stcC n=1 Tax=Glarea lozoyensis (strain ATCC 74030 / MF5533) TaxID=1104152 RepID=H0ECH0_GLAL7|nr:putative sterigmatocystin biosynthesis peroxidase stcC [Glarea lozoyensis 74030]